MSRILIVEDEESFSDPLSYLLEKEGFEVAVAADGNEALAAVRSHQPDAVVMDVMMPILSGMQTLEEMRKTPGLDGVPVILMSETSPRASTPRHWQAFLKKPFRLEQLLEAVARVSGVQGRA